MCTVQNWMYNHVHFSGGSEGFAPGATHSRRARVKTCCNKLLRQPGFCHFFEKSFATTIYLQKNLWIFISYSSTTSNNVEKSEVSYSQLASAKCLTLPLYHLYCYCWGNQRWLQLWESNVSTNSKCSCSCLRLLSSAPAQNMEIQKGPSHPHIIFDHQGLDFGRFPIPWNIFHICL